MSWDTPGADERLEKTITRNSDMVYRLAFSMLKHRADADDIHQEVFVRYLRRRPFFESREHEKAWFLKVTVNCCKNYWHTAWHRKRAELTEGGETATEALKPEHEELIAAIKALPLKYRAVIHLFYYEDLQVEEIGRLLNTKPSTVRTQLTRARALLKKS